MAAPDHSARFGEEEEVSEKGGLAGKVEEVYDVSGVDKVEFVLEGGVAGGEGGREHVGLEEVEFAGGGLVVEFVADLKVACYDIYC